MVVSLLIQKYIKKALIFLALYKDVSTKGTSVQNYSQVREAFIFTGVKIVIVTKYTYGKLSIRACCVCLCIRITRG